MPEMIQLIFSDIFKNCDVHDAGTLFFNHVNTMSDDFLCKCINTINMYLDEASQERAKFLLDRMQHQSVKFWTHLSNILNPGQR